MSAAIAALTLLLSVNVAADFDAGAAAFKAGDYKAAFEEFESSAVQGDASTQNMLGLMCSGGIGTLQDYKEAAKWFTRAAEQGHADAQLNLARMYRKGQGVLRDNVYVHMWANIASFNGSDGGGSARDSTANYMTADQIAEAQQLARECINKSYKDC